MTRPALAILAAVSVSHMLNDMMQTLAPALYPVFKDQYALTYFQVGLIQFVFQVTASLFQPLIGAVGDRKPNPRVLPCSMIFTLIGLVLLAFSYSYPTLLLSVAMIGLGSAVFHPEASRAARAASGGQHGFAQSVFQVGGNFGTSLGPLLAAYIVVPRGQRSVLLLTSLAGLAIVLLTRVAQWQLRRPHQAAHTQARPASGPVPKAMLLLVILLFSKTFYLASINNFYIFYLEQNFHISLQASQVLLFVFLAAVAVGTYAGGPIGDRIGRKYVIWGSILGVLPLTLLLPHLALVGTVVDSIAIGLVLSSAFSAIVVYATELAPAHVGAVAGLFFGLSFGFGGLGAALLGLLVDAKGLTYVYHLCAYLPAIGLLAYFLPNIHARKGTGS